MRLHPTLALLFAAALLTGGTADAQDFKQQIERGQYVELGKKLKPHLELDKYDEKLRAYCQMNLDYLARGAKPRVPGSEIILVRGAKNDKLFTMPNLQGKKVKDDRPELFTQPETYRSGGPRLMLPNKIRHLRMAYDKRLPFIDRYFVSATDLLGGNGAAKRELELIIAHHKGGGLGTSANSTASVLISASTQPLWAFGPPYYILKVAPERAIFNWRGLSGELEVLLPFWILPHEIVFRGDTREEIENHPLYKNSALKDVPFNAGGFGGENNWVKIERNIRGGRLPLPLDQAEENIITGTVVRAGSTYFVEDAQGVRHRVTDSATRKVLQAVRGETARIKGESKPVAGESYRDVTVEALLSPTHRTLTGVSIGYDEKLRTADGMSLEASGSLARAIPKIKPSLGYSDKLKVEGYVFTDTSERPIKIQLTQLWAKTKEPLKLRRPSGTTLPAGSEVSLRYVTSSDDPAVIVRSGTKWGWSKLSELAFGEAAGISGVLNNN